MSRLASPAAERNKEPISDVLAGVLPRAGTVLEIASGSGQHVVCFAKRFANLTFQPSDPTASARASIDLHRDDEALANVRSALHVDVIDPGWERELHGTSIAAVVCINMIHIAPWEATEGLFRGAAALLEPGAPCVLYGPYRFGGHFRAESNAAFDESLRSRDPRWGVRDLDDVTRVADAAGFERRDLVDMPANNHVVVFTRV
jgi:SAM-dependent methyltransferase